MMIKDSMDIKRTSYSLTPMEIAEMVIGDIAPSERATIYEAEIVDGRVVVVTEEITHKCAFYNK